MWDQLINKHRFKVYGILFLIPVVIAGCGKTPQGTPLSNDSTVINVSTTPVTSGEKNIYIAEHYWDHFNFTDTALISKPEVTEQAFADFIYMLPNLQPGTADRVLISLMDAASACKAMFLHFADMAEKYLYEPNSPYRNEEYYITVLHYILSSPLPSDPYKARCRYQLGLALKNRPGEVATDFGFTLKNGRKMKLSQVSAVYTILFFNNPDCRDCARVKEILSRLADSRVKIVAVYPNEDIELWQRTPYPASWINGRTTRIRDEELYDLRAVPTLYLLDKEKRVILKDATVESIMNWFGE